MISDIGISNSTLRKQFVLEWSGPNWLTVAYNEIFFLRLKFRKHLKTNIGWLSAEHWVGEEVWRCIEMRCETDCVRAKKSSRSSSYLQWDYLHDQMEILWYGNRADLGEIHVHWDDDDILGLGILHNKATKYSRRNDSREGKIPVYEWIPNRHPI